jgi:Ser/Thr protein kinase RdoA (MazF antagonist)
MLVELVIPVYRSLLSDTALAERLLPEYDLPQGATCHFWNQSINDTYLVRAGDTQLMLRIAPAQRRSSAQVASEIDLLHFLYREGLQVPQPIARRDGTYVRVLAAPEGPRHAVLFTAVPGTAYTPTPANSSRYGQAIAQLHTVTDRYRSDQPIWRFETADLLDRPLELLQPWFARRPTDLAFLLGLVDRLRPTLASMPQAAPIYGLCHGDLNNQNIHLIGDNAWALLDFEYIGYGWRVFDIATFFNNQLNQEGDSAQTRALLRAFLAGYQSLRPLSSEELAALPAFVALRQLWMWGIAMTNRPMVGLGLFDHWMFEISLPILRGWMREYEHLVQN